MQSHITPVFPSFLKTVVCNFIENSVMLCTFARENRKRKDFTYDVKTHQDCRVNLRQALRCGVFEGAVRRRHECGKDEYGARFARRS